MNRLHGDHTAEASLEERDVAAALVSHDIGTPCTTRAKGWVCDSYSFLTIEFFGVTKSAE